MDKGDGELWRKLGGVEEGVATIGMYCMRDEKINFKKEKEKKYIEYHYLNY